MAFREREQCHFLDPPFQGTESADPEFESHSSCWSRSYLNSLPVILHRINNALLSRWLAHPFCIVGLMRSENLESRCGMRQVVGG